MSDSTVSVIITAYRAAHTINRAIDSLLTQTRLPDEILVVDDGSPDDLATALSRYGERVKLIRKPNGGAASARNLGIERSRGELVAFLDADDYWEPKKLQKQLEILQAYPQVVLVAGRYFASHQVVNVPGRIPISTRGMLGVCLSSVEKRHPRSRRRSGPQQSSSDARVSANIASFRASRGPRIAISGFG